jgi:hypothetical protein
MKNVDELIAPSIETREVLIVRYNVGSQPGTIREIVPIEIIGIKLQAKCLTSKSTKSFVIEKLEIPDKAASASDKSWSSAANVRPRKNPWTLRAPEMNTKVFGDLGKVVEVLLEQAAKCSPIG